MRSSFFYGSLASFGVGIGVQTIFPFTLEIMTSVMFVGFVLALLWRKNSKAVFAPQLLLMSILIISFSVGLLRLEMASWQFEKSTMKQLLEQSISLTGVVISEPDERERTVQFFIKTETDKVLVSTDRFASIAYGDEVVVNGKLEIPEEFTTGLGRIFNYPGYLKAKGVEYQILFAEVERVGSGRGNFFIEKLLTAKHVFITTLQKIIPEPAAGLASGLLLGVKSALGEDLENDFRRTGIIHIVVLSGYNVMLVVAFIIFCFSYVLSLRWRLLMALVSIVAFSLVVGLSATVVRASVMASLVLIAQLIKRQYNVLRALLFTATVMLLVNPHLLIYDIGFQLSFMATLGLVLILPLFETKIINGKGIGVREFFLSTLATQIAVLPLLMYHVGEVSLIAVVVNVLVLPVVPLAMLLTFLTGIVGIFSIGIASLIGFIATLSLQYILFMANWFATIPFATVTIPSFSGWSVVGLYGVMFMIWLRVKQHRGTETLAGGALEIKEGKADVTAGQILAVTPINNTNDVPIFFRK